MTRRRTLDVGVKDARAIGREFIAAWKRIAKGRTVRAPADGVYFADFATIMKFLTPRRLELVQALRAAGPVTVRALAQKLKRDYKNVHGDVQLLKRIGLIESHDARVHVPWDVIRLHTEISAKPSRRAA
ncbi:MAG: HVO_A0114 family putative DNA-binding protein [Sulfuricaulis sp.]